MSRLKRVEYEVGEDVYGRTVTLICEPSSSGSMCWTVHIEPLNQRDDSQYLRGLTKEVILEMARVVSEK